MQDFDSKVHWQSIYEQKAPTEVTWFQPRPATSLELIANCGLDIGTPIIDVGGGTSVLVDHLLEQGHSRLAVLDIARAALTASQQRLGAEADAVSWIESDITTFSSGNQFGLWHDRALFHFMAETEDRQSYLRALKKHLRVGGHLILASFAIDGPEKCSGLPVVQYDAEKLQAELGPSFRLVEERIEEHITPARRAQKFAYFCFVRDE